MYVIGVLRCYVFVCCEVLCCAAVVTAGVWLTWLCVVRCCAVVCMHVMLFVLTRAVPLLVVAFRCCVADVDDPCVLYCA